jgi:hypothetical protein
MHSLSAVGSSGHPHVWIVHSRLTHDNLQRGEPVPFCDVACLVNCPRYGEARRLYPHDALGDTLADDRSGVSEFSNTIYLAKSI